MSKRIEWIDIAKGLGIFLVVLGHSPVPSKLMNYIYSFHMPLFFFLSGFLFVKTKYPNFSSFITSRVKGLVIPYFLFAILDYFINIYTKTYNTTSNFFSALKLISHANINYMPTALWFLPCLFIVEIAFYFIPKIINKNIYIIVILILFSILGYGSQFNTSRPYWGADIALTGIVFYGVGYLTKNMTFDIKLKVFSKFDITLLLFVTSFIVSLNLQPRVDMLGNAYRNYFFFYLSAFLGISAICLLSQIINKSLILSFIGRNTLIILGLQIQVLLVLMTKVSSRLGIVIHSSMAMGLLYTISCIIIITPFIFIINKFFPFMVGKNYIFKLAKIKNNESI